MNYRIIFLSLFLTLSVFAGSEFMQLRSFTSDMPVNLVKQYEESTALYADEVETPWYELLFYRRHKGFVSCVDDGYHAELFSGFGPFLSFYIKDQQSEFDEDGVLKQHKAKSGLLWGMIYNSERFVERGGRYPRKAGGWNLFYGLAGYKKDLNGRKMLRFLWIPIYMK